MSQVTRRELLRAGVALGLTGPLALLGSCAGQMVEDTPDAYDVVVVGGGTAGAIVTSRLQHASSGRLRILVIEAGGPTTAAIGGTARPPWLPPGGEDLTLFDVPGSYSQMAFMPLGQPYQLSETAFTFQGVGLGGNSMFNGMLFQTTPPQVFERGWPMGWRQADMAPCFERVRQRVPVTNTPSSDGQAYNTAAAEIVHPLYAAAGYIEADTSRPFAAPGAYSRPFVAAAGGQRAGPISGWFAAVAPAGLPAQGLEILPYAKAQQLVLDGSQGRVLAVEYAARAGLDQSLPGRVGQARLAAGGLVVLAAGALVTPRLLLLSGIGPRGLESQIFPDQQHPAFAIDNPLVGVGLFDHVMTSLTYSYTGPGNYQAYNYGDYARNEADLQRYLAAHAGPYAHYQPVSILNYMTRGDLPEVELFVNPNGVGTPGGVYYPHSALTVYIMLLNPQTRGMITLDAQGHVQYPNIYLAGSGAYQAAGAADAALMAEATFNALQLFGRHPGLRLLFGPGGLSHPGLDPNRLEDVYTYCTGPAPVDGVYYNRLIINHYGGTAPLSAGPGGVDPQTLLLRGTTNVAVVDAALLPTMVPAHPVGTIMAVAERASDLLIEQWV